MKFRKSRLMRETEARVGAPLEDYIPAQINGSRVHDGELTALAGEINVSKATLGYWMLKMGIRTAQMAVRPGDRLYAIAADGSERLLLEVE